MRTRLRVKAVLLAGISAYILVTRGDTHEHAA
jgi:hypothetical protein